MSVIPELDFPDGEGPPIYVALTEALQRLLDDEPTDPTLRALREEADEHGATRPVPITQKNVAIECGKPFWRKHISGEKSTTYPRLAAYILSLRPTHGVSENTSIRLDRQAREIAELDQRVRTLRSRVLEAQRAKDAVEAELLDAQDHIVRLKRQLAA